MHGFFDQCCMADIFQENDKFITAGPYEDIFFIKKQTEQVRQCYQYLISEKMTVGIVCIFKIIQIENDKAAGSKRIFIVQVFIDQFPAEKMIIEHGERILHGTVFQKGFPVCLPGNVPDNKHKTPGDIDSIQRIYLKKQFL